MAVLKVETDIITSITASLTGLAVLLVIMYVEIFKTGVIVFIVDVTLTDNFQYQSHLFHMQVTKWPNIFVDQGPSAEFSDKDFITVHIKGKMSNLPIKYNINDNFFRQHSPLISVCKVFDK